jgi:3-deoxy-7-phosphoheptulonate synthase
VTVGYPQVHRESRSQDTVVSVRGVNVGGPEIVVIAGPCAVEDEPQLLSTARAVKACGARMLRGGAFKPRTSPYSFQGLRDEGLALLARARADTGLPVVTEVMDVRRIADVAEHADVLQIGSRNMQNFVLLEEVGRCRVPVLLKRGMSATLDEYLHAAEYVLRGGNDQVILCERGIRTFETATRNTLDLNAVAWARRHTHLPVVVDPSHGTGRRDLVSPLSLAAIAAGGDGLLLEVHPDPHDALCDGDQSLTCEQLTSLVPGLRRVGEAVGRSWFPVPLYPRWVAEAAAR